MARALVVLVGFIGWSFASVPETAFAEPQLPIVRAAVAQHCGPVVPCDARERDPVSNPAPMLRDGELRTLPLPGVYEFDASSARSVVIAFGESGAVNADIAHRFATAASDGSADDHADFAADRRAFVRSLFSRDSPAGLACGTTTQALGLILDDMGLSHRTVQWIGSAGAHQSLEVFLPESGWTLYDAHFGLAFAPGVSALDVFEIAQRGAPFGPSLSRVLVKASWIAQPWNAYRDYQTAVAHVDGDRVAMLVAEGRRCCSLSEVSGRTVERLDREAFARRFYIAD